MSVRLANSLSKGFNEQKSSKKAKEIELTQEIEELLSQMEKSYDFCTQIINVLFNCVNMVNDIERQVFLSLEKSNYTKNQALKNQSQCFEKLQQMVSQGQFAQENSNAAFSLAGMAQMKAQATQNFANATFALRQRVLDITDSNQALLNQNILLLASRADNLSSAVQSLAESAQSYYYSMQNRSEKIQEKVNQAYKNINDISNILEPDYNS